LLYPKKTQFRAELELVSVKGEKIRPTSTPKGTEPFIIRFLMKRTLKRSSELKNFCRKVINKISGSKKDMWA
jgi:hypothetical protein